MGTLATTSPKKSTVASLTAALQRAKGQVDKAKETGTMVIKEIVTTAESGVVSGVTGFCDAAFGKEDANGVRIHRTQEIPTSMLAGFAVKGFAALGGFGDFQRDGFAAGTGAICGYTTLQGYSLGTAFRNKRLSEKKPETTSKAVVTAPAATAAA